MHMQWQSDTIISFQFISRPNRPSSFLSWTLKIYKENLTEFYILYNFIVKELRDPYPETIIIRLQIHNHIIEPYTCNQTRNSILNFIPNQMAPQRSWTRSACPHT